jgi:long-chain acyl-CoA synthetase
MTDVPIYHHCHLIRSPASSGIRGRRDLRVDQGGRAEKIREVLAASQLKAIIGFDDIPGLTNMSIAELERRGGGDKQSIDSLPRRRAAGQTGRPATIIYTSGTTGEPRGYSPRQHLLQRRCLANQKFHSRARTPLLSFLPLSHIFERMAGHYLMFATGTSIAYAESIDTVPVNLREVKPTLVLSVPRLYGEDRARVLEAAHGRISQEEDFLLGTWRRRAMGE